MKQSNREALDAYYREAGSWAENRGDELRASRRIAWIVASVAVVIALCEALALIALLPLKTVVPYTLMVDRQTGYVQELKPLDQQKVAPDAALTRSFLVQYVIARENFAIGEAQSNYRKATLWSADAAKSDYVTLMQVNNPASPLARLPRSTVVDTQVKSVSSLGGNTALVRFDTVRRDANGQPQPARPWVAVISYRFSTGPLSSQDRFLNPLGFQVVRYRRDQEAIVPDAAPVADAAPPSQPQVYAPGTPAAVPAPVSVPATGRR
jgi:type IV secretion system protein VirB8